MLDFVEQLLAVLSSERPPTGEHLVQDDPQAPDIAAAVQTVRLTAHLFRRHVRRRAGPFPAQPALDALVNRQAEIGDVRLPLFVQQDVAGLQIAVNEVLAVSERQSLADGDHQLYTPLGMDSTGLDLGSQIAAGDVLLYDHHTTRIAKHVMYRHDAGVFQLDGRAGLLQKRGHLLLGGEPVRTRQLQGNQPVQFRVVGQVDGAESAYAEPLLHPVAADRFRYGLLGRLLLRHTLYVFGIRKAVRMLRAGNFGRRRLLRRPPQQFERGLDLGRLLREAAAVLVWSPPLRRLRAAGPPPWRSAPSASPTAPPPDRAR